MSVIHVSTTPEVRKFVLFECRDQVYMRGHEPIIKLNRKMLLGNMIACLMSEDLSNFRPQKRPEVYLSFEVSRRFDSSYLTEDGVKRIRLHLDRWFKQDFCKYIDFCHAYGSEVEAALEQYRANYHIEEEDYSFDSMRSYYLRYGKRNFRDGQKHQEQRIMIQRLLQAPTSTRPALSKAS